MTLSSSTARRPGAGVAQALAKATHVLVSAPPDADGDPVLRHHAADLAHAPSLSWIGYLSTVGVYGDSQGAWIDETMPTHATSTRGRRRIDAEQEWLALGADRERRARRSSASPASTGQAAAPSTGCARAPRIASSSRGRCSTASTSTTSPRRCSPASTGAARSRSTTSPTTSRRRRRTSSPTPPSCCTCRRRPRSRFEDAQLSPMAASFYADNKRIRNARLRQELGVALKFPTYREGLRAILADQPQQLNCPQPSQPERRRSAAVQAAPALLAKSSRAFAATLGAPGSQTIIDWRGRYAVGSEWPQSWRGVRRGVDELDV